MIRDSFVATSRQAKCGNNRDLSLAKRHFQPVITLASWLLVVPTMLRLNKAQRTLLAEKIPDVANIAAGALVFGQMLDGGHFSRSLALIGCVAWGLLMGFAMTLVGGTRK